MGRGMRTRRSSYSPLSGLKPQKGQSVAGSGLGIRLRFEGIGEMGCYEPGAGITCKDMGRKERKEKRRNLIWLFSDWRVSLLLCVCVLFL
jgi:hypothetical protein